jgi:serine phosphatase RsbU (regulator of sigma subunit)
MEKAPVISVAAATRNFPGELVSGDGWRLDRSTDYYRIALIDGLGHGVLAAEATQLADNALALEPGLRPSDALRVCHVALRGTRGAAMSVALIDPISRKLTSAGVGNVDIRLIQGGRERRSSSDRGIVGSVLPTIHDYTADLTADWLLVLHSDGISSRFTLASLAWQPSEGIQSLADAILREHARPTDDATVVVVAPFTQSDSVS